MSEQVIPTVGKHPKTEAIVYHNEWKALSAGLLGAMKKSPAYCRWLMDQPMDFVTAPHLAFGKAVHTGLLEPEAFSERYVVDPEHPDGGYPQGWRNRNDYKSQVESLLDAGLELLPRDQYDAVRTIQDRIEATPSKARDLLRSVTDAEVSIAADDPETGIRSKIRPDSLCANEIMLEVKTAQDIAPHAFSSAIVRFGYHRRKAFYQRIIRALDGPESWPFYAFLCIESSPPYDFVVYDLEPEATELGEWEVGKLMQLYAECVEKDEWPGYPTTVQSIGVPRWAMSEFLFGEG